MEFSREYDRVRFKAEVLREASATLFSGLDGEPSGSLVVEVEEGKWSHDSEEEFFADYRRSSQFVYFDRRLERHKLCVQCFATYTLVELAAPSRERILKTFAVFDRNRETSMLPPEPQQPPVVFIGHGGSPLWKELKDHLHEKHEFKVEAYEIGARAGHAIRYILEHMLRRSSFALLVMTGEDETAEGGLRARQNVVHEAGLFQGKLGFDRAVVLLEKGTEVFSNLDGIQQIRFSPGNIKETFGEVLATLRREFEPRGT